DDPVRALDHLQVVLDHDDRVPGLNQALKQPHQDRDIIEVQARRGLIENEQLSSLPIPFSDFGEVSDELETLGFAAGKRIERLSQTQVTEPDFIQHVELVAKRFRLPDLSEELNRFADGHLQNVVDRFPIDLYPENVRLESAPFALRATHIKIAQELHFDLL